MEAVGGLFGWWLVGQLVCWLNDWLVGRSVRLVKWLVVRLLVVGQSVGWWSVG